MFIGRLHHIAFKYKMSIMLMVWVVLVVTGLAGMVALNHDNSLGVISCILVMGACMFSPFLFVRK